MKIRIVNLLVALALLALSTLNSQLSTALAQGTAFTYQGQLQNNGSPASGTYNLTFSLFNTNTSGVAIAGPVTNSAVSITNGLFTVLIDFGPGVFTGETNWLQIGVESNGVSSFTTLTPRQELTPTPNAIYAESANTLSGTLSASQLTSIGNTNSLYGGNFFVGGSGNATTIGFNNTANGALALNANTSGSYNVANGVLALYSNTSGSYNTADGMDALLENRSGSGNTANGFTALENNTSGSNNVADGAYALYSNSSGSYNTANGVFALENNTNDNELVAVGYQALQNENAYGNGNTSDGNGHNTAIGYQALQLNTIGAGNTAIGYQALIQNVNGNFNTANGDKALYYNTSGSQNTANGLDALYSNTSGFNNVANGVTALFSNTNGVNNTANGYEALYYNTSGSGNTANGVVALYYNTSGTFNTANGAAALESNTTGSQNTANGGDALLLNTSGSNNVAEGYGALEFNTNDNNLVAIGYEALQNDNAFGQGSPSGNGENTAIGYQALQSTTIGDGNTAIGYQALNQDTGGSYNTAIGDDALHVITGGAENTADGYAALYNITNGTGNIAVGVQAGGDLSSGNYNIYIGNIGILNENGVIRIGQPGYETVTYLAGNVSIGGASPGQELSINGGMDVDAAGSDNGTVNAAWTLLFGGDTIGEGIGSVRVAGHTDSYGLNFYTDYNKRMTILNNGNVGIGTTNPAYLFQVGSASPPAYCNGTSWVNSSDRNSKEDFAAINPQSVLAKVSALPITEWKYKVEPDGTEHLGPMAQDFHAAFGLNGADDKHIATVDEEGVALAAIQGLNEKVEGRSQKAEDSIRKLEAENAELKQQNDSLAERLNELEATVKQLAANR